jgi:hypothetical protein
LYLATEPANFIVDRFGMVEIMTDETDESLSARVMKYVGTIMNMSAKAKEPGYSIDDWQELAKMVSNDFVRVGRFREVQGWSECVDLMHRWAGVGSMKRRTIQLTEVGNKVFYELEETSTMAGKTSVFSTMNVVSFNDDKLICRYEFFQEPAKGLFCEQQ